MVNYQCDKCDKLFYQKSAYTTHINRKNSCTNQIANANNAYSKCDFEFSSYVALFNHVKNDTCEKKKAKKKKKSKIPKKIRELTWNKYIGEDEGTSLCMCCGITKISQMNFHCGHCVSEANGGSLELDNMRPICSGCNGSMGSKNMNDFMKKFKLKGEIIEPIQNLISDSETDQEIHTEIIKYKDEKGKLFYKCNKCNKKFSRKSNYECHLNRTNPCYMQLTNSSSTTCKYCDKIFSNTRSVYNHIKKGTCKKYNVEMDASINKKIENNQTEVVIKYKNEKGKLFYKCSKCDKFFKNKGDITRHVERKVPCNKSIANDDNECKYCNKKFKSYMSLYSHTKNNVCKKNYAIILEDTKEESDHTELIEPAIYRKSDYNHPKIMNTITEMCKLT